jgi:hypothetical protein
MGRREFVTHGPVGFNHLGSPCSERVRERLHPAGQVLSNFSFGPHREVAWHNNQWTKWRVEYITNDLFGDFMENISCVN